MKLLVSLLWLAAGQAGQQPPPPDEPQEAIVVTGQRIDTAAALADCLARRCPPNEDIDATLGHAEALFVDGEYQEAHRVLRHSLARNRRHAREHPEAVSDLHRGHARVSGHMGLDDDVRRSTYSTLRALQAGVAVEDHRHFNARLEISDMLTRRARFREAERELERLAGVARAAGRQDVVVLAELRRLWNRLVREPRGPARRQLIEFAAESDPERRSWSIGARILLARLYRDEGDIARSDEMIAALGRTSARRRALIIAPSPLAGIRQRIRSLSLDRIADRAWIDVGFWVQPDGTVSDVQLLRHGLSPDWAVPLVDAIRRRRYAPGSTDRPDFRLERYTLTAPWVLPNSRGQRVRSPVPRVEYLDLTSYD